MTCSSEFSALVKGEGRSDCNMTFALGRNLGEYNDNMQTVTTVRTRANKLRAMAAQRVARPFIQVKKYVRGFMLMQGVANHSLNYLLDKTLVSG